MSRLRKEPQKTILLSNFYSLWSPNGKRSYNESISWSKFSFINPQSTHCSLKFLKKTLTHSRYWFATQQQASAFRGKKCACFTWNLVQNLMSIFFSPDNGSVEVGRVWSREEVSQIVIFKFFFNKQIIYIKLKVILLYWQIWI